MLLFFADEKRKFEVLLQSLPLCYCRVPPPSLDENPKWNPVYYIKFGHLVVRMSRKHNVHALMPIGVAMVANKKALFVTLVDCVPRIEAHSLKWIFRRVWLIRCAYELLRSRDNNFYYYYGNSYAHKNNVDNDDDTTN